MWSPIGGLILEKTILLNQLDDRVKKALAIIIAMYPRLLDKTIEQEEVKGILDLIDGLHCIMTTIADIQYNDNIDKYSDIIYSLARSNQ